MNTNDMPRRWSPSRVSLPPFLLFALTLLAPAASAANPNHIAGVSWLGKSVFLTSAYNNPGVADAQIYDLALNKWNQVPNFTRPSFPLDPGSPNAITGDVFQGLLCFFSVPPRASGAPAVLELHTMDMTGKWSEAKAVPLVTPWGTSPTSIQRVRAKTYMGRLFLFVDFVNPPPLGGGRYLWTCWQVDPTVETGFYVEGAAIPANFEPVVFQQKVPGATSGQPLYRWVMGVLGRDDQKRTMSFGAFAKEPVGLVWTDLIPPPYIDPDRSNDPGLFYGPGENYAVDQVQMILRTGNRYFYNIEAGTWAPHQGGDDIANQYLWSSTNVTTATATTANPDGSLTEHLVVSGWQGQALQMQTRQSQVFQKAFVKQVIDMSKSSYDDPAAWNVIGVIQGPGVYSLNGGKYEDYKDGGPATVETAHSSGSGTATSSSTSNSVNMKAGFEGEVGFLAEAKVDTGIDVTASVENTTATTQTSEMSQTVKYSAQGTNSGSVGWLVVGKPSITVEAYKAAAMNGTLLPQTIYNSKVTGYDLQSIQFDITTLKAADDTKSQYLAGMTPAPASTDVLGWMSTASMYQGPSILDVDDGKGNLILGNMYVTPNVETCSDFKASSSKDVSVATTSQFNIHAYVAGNGMGYDYDSSVENSSSTELSASLSACLWLIQASSDPSVYPRLTDLDVHPHFLVPLTKSPGYQPPFWISTLGKKYGWAPWLLTWEVASYEGHLTSASVGSPGGSSTPRGLVHVGATPPVGGTVFVDAAETSPKIYSVGVGEGFAVEAVPAPGYRFAYWESRSAIGVRNRRARMTFGALLKEGGAALRAHFELKPPGTFEVSQSWSSDTASVHVGGAFLDPALASFDPKAETLSLLLGAKEIAVQNGTWTTTLRTRRFRSTDGTIDLVLDFGSYTWSAVVAGIDLSHLLRESKPAEAALGLRREKDRYVQYWPVRATGEWDLAGSDGVPQAIDFRSARARVEMDTALPGGAIHLVIEDAVIPCTGFDPARESSLSIGGLKLKPGRWYGGWGGLYVQYGENAQAVYEATLDPASGRLGLEAYLKTARNVIFDGGHHQTVHVSTDAGGSTESGQVHFDLASMKVSLEQTGSSASAASREQPQDTTVNWAAAPHRRVTPPAEGGGTPVQAVKR